MTYRRNCDFKVEDSERDLSAQFIDMDEQFFTPTMAKYQQEYPRPRPVSAYSPREKNSGNKVYILLCWSLYLLSCRKRNIQLLLTVDILWIREKYSHHQDQRIVQLPEPRWVIVVIYPHQLDVHLPLLWYHPSSHPFYHLLLKQNHYVSVVILSSNEQSTHAAV